MDSRERFLATMAFEDVDRVPLWEFGYWAGTVRRWYGEGLQRKVGFPDSVPYGLSVRGEGNPWSEERDFAHDIHDLFGFDKGIRRIPLNNYVCPVFPVEVLEDHGDWVLMRDEDGILCKENKDRSSLPNGVGWPVANREDWERFKAERLQPTLEGRLPANWPQLVEEFKRRDYPLCVGGLHAGFFGTPRNLLGPENLLMAFYDQPELLHDMMNYLADFWIALYGGVLDQIDADLALIWEDMAYKAGPLISPALFREFMLRPYQRLTSCLKEKGVKVILVDTDGDCWKLIPLFLEAGVTGLSPFEVNAGMDVVEVRKAFPRLQILGGLDKTKIAAGKTVIDAELEAKVPFMLRHGGYIPHVDHNVPPDVSWDNFAHYRRRLGRMIEESGQGSA
ncbi:MAG: uroporphyrinogen decarboxylase family protein [Chloroflexota bacterium]